LNHTNLYIRHCALNNTAFNSYPYLIMEKLLNIQVSWPIAPERVITEQQLAEVLKLANDEWIIEKVDATKWDTSMKNKDHDGIMIAENYRVNITARPRVSETQKTIVELLDWYTPPIRDIDEIVRNSNKLWVIEAWDLHYDKIGGKWNIDSQDKRTIQAIKRLTDKLLINWADELRFVSGWDLWNSDINYKTTKWTEQQNNMKEKDSWKRVTDLYCNILDYLWQQTKTWVRIVPWNHDYVKSHFFHHMLERLFENHPNIEIMWDCKPRQYEKYGSHLHWRDHGDAVAEKQIPELMISENPQGWIKTRWFSRFDKHKERTHRVWGVVVNQRWAAWELWEWNKRYWVDQVNNTMYWTIIDKKTWPELEIREHR